MVHILWFTYSEQTRDAQLTIPPFKVPGAHKYMEPFRGNQMLYGVHVRVDGSKDTAFIHSVQAMNDEMGGKMFTVGEQKDLEVCMQTIVEDIVRMKGRVGVSTRLVNVPMSDAVTPAPMEMAQSTLLGTQQWPIPESFYPTVALKELVGLVKWW
jgi:hypothetical protein